MADLYCEARDLYDFGMPRGAVPNPGRLASSALASTNAFTVDAHGFDADDFVSFRASDGGSLPGGISAGTMYYAIPLTDDTFSVSATEGGAAVDLTSNGTDVVVLAPLPVDRAIEWASRVIDDMLPAHVVPLTAPYPTIVVATAAELAATKLATRGGWTSKALSDVADAAHKRLERWAKGVPIRGTNAPQAAGLAVVAVAPRGDSDGWGRFGGL